MANYYGYHLDLFGPMSTLKPLLENSLFQEGDELLCPSEPPDVIPTLTAHQAIAWAKDNPFSEFRKALKRPEPFLLLEWEALMLADGKAVPHSTISPTSNDMNCAHRISTLRFFMNSINGLKPKNPTYNTPTGLPQNFGPYEHFFQVLDQQGSHDAWADITVLNNGQGHLKIDFGWWRRTLPAASSGTMGLAPRDLRDLYIIETELDEGDPEPRLGFRATNGGHLNPIAIPETAFFEEGGMEFCHDWPLWQALDHVGLPKDFLEAFFKTTEDKLRSNFEACKAAQH